MKEFISGFLIASVIFVGLLYAQSKGTTVIFENSLATDLGQCQAQNAQLAQTITAEEEADTTSKTRKRRKGRRFKGRRKAAAGVPSGPGYDAGSGQVGDDLTASARNTDLSGAEQQLSNAQIDAGIDRVWNGIQRCLALMPAGAPSSGKVVMGLAISGSGKVTKVNLKGPNAMIQGDCGQCIRRMAKSIRYPSFNGPDMTVHYPIQFD